MNKASERDQRMFKNRDGQIYRVSCRCQAPATHHRHDLFLRNHFTILPSVLSVLENVGWKTNLGWVLWPVQWSIAHRQSQIASLRKGSRHPLWLHTGAWAVCWLVREKKKDDVLPRQLGKQAKQGKRDPRPPLRILGVAHHICKSRRLACFVHAVSVAPNDSVLLASAVTNSDGNPPIYAEERVRGC